MYKENYVCIPFPGYSDGVIHIYIVKVLLHIDTSPEKGELIEVIE